MKFVFILWSLKTLKTNQLSFLAYVPKYIKRAQYKVKYMEEAIAALATVRVEALLSASVVVTTTGSGQSAV